MLKSTGRILLGIAAVVAVVVGICIEVKGFQEFGWWRLLR
jgi:hypothetical protein